MVTFSELRVDSKSGKLIINASVNSLSYYDNVYISKLYIFTQEEINATSPSSSLSKAILTKTYDETTTKSISEVLENTTDIFSKTVDMSANMFFVIIECSGTPSSDTPCGMDNQYTIGVTFDNCPVYNKLLSLVKELNNTCSVPKNMINYYLQYELIKIALATNHYQEAINIYTKYFLNQTSTSTTSTCGCNG